MRPPPGSPADKGATQSGVEHLAIMTALTLRTVYHLALRQTEGFVASLIGLMGLELRTPTRSGWTTRRYPGAAAPWRCRSSSAGTMVRSIWSSTPPA